MRLVVAGVLILFISASVAAQSAADDDAIHAHLDALTKVRQTGNRPAEARFYTEDGDEWGSGSFNRGRKALAARTVTTSRPGYRTEFVSLQFLDAKTALIDQNYFNEQQLAGHVFYLMVKRDGRWLIRSSRVTPMAPVR